MGYTDPTGLMEIEDLGGFGVMAAITPARVRGLRPFGTTDSEQTKSLMRAMDAAKIGLSLVAGVYGANTGMAGVASMGTDFYDMLAAPTPEDTAVAIGGMFLDQVFSLGRNKLDDIIGSKYKISKVDLEGAGLSTGDYHIKNYKSGAQIVSRNPGKASNVRKVTKDEILKTIGPKRSNGIETLLKGAQVYLDIGDPGSKAIGDAKSIFLAAYINVLGKGDPATARFMAEQAFSQHIATDLPGYQAKYDPEKGILNIVNIQNSSKSEEEIRGEVEAFRDSKIKEGYTEYELVKID